MIFLKRHARLMSTMVLGVGIVAVALAFYGRLVSATSIPPTGFTMVQTTLFTPAGKAEPRLQGSVVRYQDSDGPFKQISTYFDPGVARVRTLVSLRERGAFNVNEAQQRLDFVARPLKPLAGEVFFTEDFLKQSPNFVGEGTILGYKTCIWREPETDGYTELHFALALLGLPIKRVRVSSAGTSVTEATHVLLGDPDPAFLTTVPDYPVDYTFFQEKIDAMEQAHKSAAGLRNDMADSQVREAVQ